MGNLIFKARSLALVMLIATPIHAFAQTGDTDKSPPPLDAPKAADETDKAPLAINDYDSHRMQELSVYMGIEQTYALPYLPPGASFRGDFKKIVSVSVNKETNTLLFKATKEGIANLTIHDGKGKKIYEFHIATHKSDLTKVANEIRALLNDVEGITIKIVNNKVIVDGQVLLPRDLSRIISVIMQFPDKAASLVTLSPLAQRRIAAAILTDINNPEIGVRAVNDKFILEGQADSEDEKNRAEGIAQVYVPDLVKEAGEKDGTIVKLRKSFVLNFIKIKAKAPPEPGKIIQLVIHYVELSKDYTKDFRFQFTPTVSDSSGIVFTGNSTGTGGLMSSITGTISNLLPKLNWAKTHGHARILKSSTLIVLDGQKGELKNVTKVPYATINAQGQSTTNSKKRALLPTLLLPSSTNVRIASDFSSTSS